VLLFCMLTGNFPWENADIGDIYFSEFVAWQRRKTSKVPSQWKRFTPKFLRYFRKTLDIKPEKRCEVKEINKFISDNWLLPCRVSGESSADEDEECESDSEQGDNLALILQNHGIDTRVDKHLRDVRISEWLLSLWLVRELQPFICACTEAPRCSVRQTGGLRLVFVIATFISILVIIFQWT